MLHNGLTSVIIPVYHEKPFRLLRAVESALRQQNLLEVIVVFDQTDASDFPYSGHPRVRVLTTGQDATGPSVARNLGIEAATGEFIAFLDSDDYFLGSKLLAMIPWAARRGAAYDNSLICREDDFGKPMSPLSRYLQNAQSGEYAPQFFAKIHHPLFGVFKRDAIGDIRFEENYRFAEDVLFNMAIIEQLGGAYFYELPLHQYVVRQESLSHSKSHEMAEMIDHTYQKICREIEQGILPGSAETVQIFRMKQRMNRQYHQAVRLDSSLDFHQFIEQNRRMGWSAGDVAV